MRRKLLAFFAGFFTALLVFVAFEKLNEKIYPLPEGLDTADHQAMEAYIQTLPTKSYLIILAGWTVGSFFCGLLIRLLSRSSDPSSAYIAGLLLLTAGIVNMFTLPHPAWFIITGLLIFIPLTLLGHSVVRRN